MRKRHVSENVKNSSMMLTAFLLFVVSAILTVSCYVVYRQVHRELRTIAIEESGRALSQSADNISAALDYTMTVFTGNTLWDRVGSLMGTRVEDGSVTYGTLYTLREELRSHFYTNSYIQDVGLFIENGERDHWCSLSVISDDFARDYRNGLYRLDGMTYEKFREEIINSVDNRRIHRGYLTGFVTSRYSVPQPYSAYMMYMVYPLKLSGNDLRIYAVMQINLDDLSRELLSSQYCGDYISLYNTEGTAYTTDAGIVLPELENASSYYEKGTDTWYLRGFINELGLSCHISLDKNKIYASIAPFSGLLSGLFLVMAAIFCIFMYFLFRYWFMPISRIADSIPEGQGENRNVVKKIRQHLVMLSAQNASTLSLLQDYQLNDLMKSVYAGEKMSASDCAALKQVMPVGENNFRCICIGRLDGNSSLLPDVAQMTAFLSDADILVTAGVLLEGTFTCLILQPENAIYQEASELYDALNRLLKELNREGYLYAIGISDVYSGYAGIPQAYQEAGSGWRSAVIWQNAAVVFNAALSKYSSYYHVSYMQLDSMYQAIVSSHKDQAMAIFEQMVFDNFGNMKDVRIRALYWQQFENDVLGVLIRVSTQYDIYAVIESYLSKSAHVSLSKRISLLGDAILESGEFIPVHDYDGDMANAIHKYCVEHCCDYQLSLTALSERFHLSKSSLSKFFKAHFGINFVTYIERMRMQRAEALLLERKLTVREIAEAVGYQNITTFYNAFRKVKKCTPTQWREQREAVDQCQSV